MTLISRRGRIGLKFLTTSVALAALLSFTPRAKAAPQVGKVVQGAATIASGAATVITQSTNRAVIDWQSFNVAQNESVEFKLPNPNGATLNRVVGAGATASHINGAITSNGAVYLVNPHGLIFEATSRVTANGFTASTGAITNQQFMAKNPAINGFATPTGQVQLNGTITANTIQALGTQVTIGGSLNANSVTSNGGEISLSSTKQTTVTTTAAITANAGVTGNGGRIILWSDIHTAFTGAIAAKGGSSGGDGGFVEVSGKLTLDFRGTVTTLAAHGKTGTLLLDPTDITISSGTHDASPSGTATTYTGGSSATSIINVTTLVTALNSNNVLIDATAGSGTGSGRITVADAIVWTSATTSLTLTAGVGGIYINAPITSGAHAGTSLILNSGGDIYIKPGARWSLGGNVEIKSAGVRNFVRIDLAGNALLGGKSIIASGLNLYYTSVTSGNNVTLEIGTGNYISVTDKRDVTAPYVIRSGAPDWTSDLILSQDSLVVTAVTTVTSSAGGVRVISIGASPSVQTGNRGVVFGGKVTIYGASKIYQHDTGDLRYIEGTGILVNGASIFTKSLTLVSNGAGITNGDTAGILIQANLITLSGDLTLIQSGTTTGSGIQVSGATVTAAGALTLSQTGSSADGIVIANSRLTSTGNILLLQSGSVSAAGIRLSSTVATATEFVAGGGGWVRFKTNGQTLSLEGASNSHVSSGKLRIDLGTGAFTNIGGSYTLNALNTDVYYSGATTTGAYLKARSFSVVTKADGAQNLVAATAPDVTLYDSWVQDLDGDPTQVVGAGYETSGELTIAVGTTTGYSYLMGATISGNADTVTAFADSSILGLAIKSRTAPPPPTVVNVITTSNLEWDGTTLTGTGTTSAELFDPKTTSRVTLTIGAGLKLTLSNNTAVTSLLRFKKIILGAGSEIIIGGLGLVLSKGVIIDASAGGAIVKQTSSTSPLEVNNNGWGTATSKGLVLRGSFGFSTLKLTAGDLILENTVLVTSPNKVLRLDLGASGRILGGTLNAEGVNVYLPTVVTAHIATISVGDNGGVYLPVPKTGAVLGADLALSQAATVAFAGLTIVGGGNQVGIAVVSVGALTLSTVTVLGAHPILITGSSVSLSGTNSFAGSVRLTGGTVSLSGSNSFGGSLVVSANVGAVTLAGGTIRVGKYATLSINTLLNQNLVLSSATTVLGGMWLKINLGTGAFAAAAAATTLTAAGWEVLYTGARTGTSNRGTIAVAKGSFTYLFDLSSDLVNKVFTDSSNAADVGIGTVTYTTPTGTTNRELGGLIITGDTSVIATTIPAEIATVTAARGNKISGIGVVYGGSVEFQGITSGGTGAAKDLNYVEATGIGFVNFTLSSFAKHLTLVSSGAGFGHWSGIAGIYIRGSTLTVDGDLTLVQSGNISNPLSPGIKFDLGASVTSTNGNLTLLQTGTTASQGITLGYGTLAAGGDISLVQSGTVGGDKAGIGIYHTSIPLTITPGGATNWVTLKTNNRPIFMLGTASFTIGQSNIRIDTGTAASSIVLNVPTSDVYYTGAGGGDFTVKSFTLVTTAVGVQTLANAPTIAVSDYSWVKDSFGFSVGAVGAGYETTGALTIAAAKTLGYSYLAGASISGPDDGGTTVGGRAWDPFVDSTVLAISVKSRTVPPQPAVNLEFTSVFDWTGTQPLTTVVGTGVTLGDIFRGKSGIQDSLTISGTLKLLDLGAASNLLRFKKITILSGGSLTIGGKGLLLSGGVTIENALGGTFSQTTDSPILVSNNGWGSGAAATGLTLKGSFGLTHLKTTQAAGAGGDLTLDAAGVTVTSTSIKSLRLDLGSGKFLGAGNILTASGMDVVFSGATSLNTGTIAVGAGSFTYVLDKRAITAAITIDDTSIKETGTTTAYTLPSYGGSSGNRTIAGTMTVTGTDANIQGLGVIFGGTVTVSGVTNPTTVAASSTSRYLTYIEAAGVAFTTTASAFAGPLMVVSTGAGISTSLGYDGNPSTITAGIGIAANLTTTKDLTLIYKGVFSGAGIHISSVTVGTRVAVNTGSGALSIIMSGTGSSGITLNTSALTAASLSIEMKGSTTGWGADAIKIEFSTLTAATGNITITNSGAATGRGMSMIGSSTAATTVTATLGSITLLHSGSSTGIGVYITSSTLDAKTDLSVINAGTAAGLYGIVLRSDTLAAEAVNLKAGSNNFVTLRSGGKDIALYVAGNSNFTGGNVRIDLSQGIIKSTDNNGINAKTLAADFYVLNAAGRHVYYTGGSASGAKINLGTGNTIGSFTVVQTDSGSQNLSGQTASAPALAWVVNSTGGAVASIGAGFATDGVLTIDSDSSSEWSYLEGRTISGSTGTPSVAFTTYGGYGGSQILARVAQAVPVSETISTSQIWRTGDTVTTGSVFDKLFVAKDSTPIKLFIANNGTLSLTATDMAKDLLNIRSITIRTGGTLIIGGRGINLSGGIKIFNEGGTVTQEDGATISVDTVGSINWGTGNVGLTLKGSLSLNNLKVRGGDLTLNGVVTVTPATKSLRLDLAGNAMKGSGTLNAPGVHVYLTSAATGNLATIATGSGSFTYVYDNRLNTTAVTLTNTTVATIATPPASNTGWGTALASGSTSGLTLTGDSTTNLGVVYGGTVTITSVNASDAAGSLRYIEGTSIYVGNHSSFSGGLTLVGNGTSLTYVVFIGANITTNGDLTLRQTGTSGGVTGIYVARTLRANGGGTITLSQEGDTGSGSGIAISSGILIAEGDIMLLQTGTTTHANAIGFDISSGVKPSLTAGVGKTVTLKTNSLTLGLLSDATISGGKLRIDLGTGAFKGVTFTLSSVGDVYFTSTAATHTGTIKSPNFYVTTDKAGGTYVAADFTTPTAPVGILGLPSTIGRAIIYSGAVTINGATGTLAFPIAIVGSSVTLSGTNSFSGSVGFDTTGGDLSLGGTLAVGSGKTITLGASGSIVATGFTMSGTTSLKLTSGKISGTLTASGMTVQYFGPASGNSGTINVGSGSFAFMGTSDRTTIDATTTLGDLGMGTGYVGDSLGGLTIVGTKSYGVVFSGTLTINGVGSNASLVNGANKLSYIEAAGIAVETTASTFSGNLTLVNTGQLSKTVLSVFWDIGIYIGANLTVNGGGDLTLIHSGTIGNQVSRAIYVFGATVETTGTGNISINLPGSAGYNQLVVRGSSITAGGNLTIVQSAIATTTNGIMLQDNSRLSAGSGGWVTLKTNGLALELLGSGSTISGGKLRIDLGTGAITGAGLTLDASAADVYYTGATASGAILKAKSFTAVTKINVDATHSSAGGVITWSLAAFEPWVAGADGASIEAVGSGFETTGVLTLLGGGVPGYSYLAGATISGTGEAGLTDSTVAGMMIKSRAPVAPIGGSISVTANLLLDGSLYSTKGTRDTLTIGNGFTVTVKHDTAAVSLLAFKKIFVLSGGTLVIEGKGVTLSGGVSIDVAAGGTFTQNAGAPITVNNLGWGSGTLTTKGATLKGTFGLNSLKVTSGDLTLDGAVTVTSTTSNLRIDLAAPTGQTGAAAGRLLGGGTLTATGVNLYLTSATSGHSATINLGGGTLISIYDSRATIGGVPLNSTSASTLNLTPGNNIGWGTGFAWTGSGSSYSAGGLTVQTTAAVSNISKLGVAFGGPVTMAGVIATGAGSLSYIEGTAFDTQTAASTFAGPIWLNSSGNVTLSQNLTTTVGALTISANNLNVTAAITVATVGGLTINATNMTLGAAFTTGSPSVGVDVTLNLTGNYSNSASTTVAGNIWTNKDRNLALNTAGFGTMGTGTVFAVGGGTFTVNAAHKAVPSTDEPVTKWWDATAGANPVKSTTEILVNPFAAGSEWGFYSGLEAPDSTKSWMKFETLTNGIIEQALTGGPGTYTTGGLYGTLLKGTSGDIILRTAVTGAAPIHKLLSTGSPASRAVTFGGVGGSGTPVTLPTMSAASLTFSGNNYFSGAVTLTTTAAITQTTGAITMASGTILTMTSGGAISLNGANAIATLGVVKAKGAITIKNAENLVISENIYSNWSTSDNGGNANAISFELTNGKNLAISKAITSSGGGVKIVANKYTNAGGFAWALSSNSLYVELSNSVAADFSGAAVFTHVGALSGGKGVASTGGNFGAGKTIYFTTERGEQFKLSEKALNAIDSNGELHLWGDLLLTAGAGLSKSGSGEVAFSASVGASGYAGRDIGFYRVRNGVLSVSLQQSSVTILGYNSFNTVANNALNFSGVTNLKFSDYAVLIVNGAVTLRDRITIDSTAIIRASGTITAATAGLTVESVTNGALTIDGALTVSGGGLSLKNKGSFIAQNSGNSISAITIINQASLNIASTQDLTITATEGGFVSYNVGGTITINGNFIGSSGKAGGLVTLNNSNSLGMIGTTSGDGITVTGSGSNLFSGDLNGQSGSTNIANGGNNLIVVDTQIIGRSGVTINSTIDAMVKYTTNDPMNTNTRTAGLRLNAGRDGAVVINANLGAMYSTWNDAIRVGLRWVEIDGKSVAKTNAIIRTIYGSGTDFPMIGNPGIGNVLFNVIETVPNLPNLQLNGKTFSYSIGKLWKVQGSVISQM